MADRARSGTGAWSQRLGAARTIAVRQRDALVSGIGIYLTMAAALFAASVTLHNAVRFVERNAVLSARQPLLLPVTLIVILFSFVLGSGAALAVARERDRGTYRVLMFGPADEASFVLGHFAAQVTAYALMALFGVVWANLATFALNLDFSPIVIAAFAVSVLSVSAVVALGLLLGAWGGKARSTVAYLVLITLALVGLQIGVDVLTGLSLAANPTQNDPIFVVRDALVGVNNVARWASPYAQLSEALDALATADAGRFVLHAGVTVAQTLAFLAAAIGTLRRKEAR